jgi:hypothetical protein
MSGHPSSSERPVHLQDKSREPRQLTAHTQQLTSERFYTTKTRCGHRRLPA